MKRGLLLAFLVAPAIVLFGAIRPVTLDARGQPACDDERGPTKEFDIAFLVFRDDILGVGPRDCVREVNVMMDETAFSEETVKRLSAYLSETFIKPRHMHVFYFTSVEQVYPFGPANVSGTPPPAGYSKHHRGLYTRTENDELIRFTEKPTDVRLKTVILKGKDAI